jgi:hypothetical protein
MSEPVLPPPAWYIWKISLASLKLEILVGKPTSTSSCAIASCFKGWRSARVSRKYLTGCDLCIHINLRKYFDGLQQRLCQSSRWLLSLTRRYVRSARTLGRPITTTHVFHIVAVDMRTRIFPPNRVYKCLVIHLDKTFPLGTRRLTTFLPLCFCRGLGFDHRRRLSNWNQSVIYRRQIAFTYRNVCSSKLKVPISLSI